jgi:low temperature requirement protein LtrA
MKYFRVWWQRPRQYSEQEEERRITFLELFYDLVYVVIIAELAHALSSNISIGGFLQYTFLFLMIWWAWFNGAMYHDLHGNNDIRTRVMTFLQMMAVGTMAVFANRAMDSGSSGFALSYGAFLLIITYLWWRTGVHEKAHRPLSVPYTITYLLASTLTLGSVFIMAPWRFYLWGFNLFLIVLLPLVLMIAGGKVRTADHYRIGGSHCRGGAGCGRSTSFCNPVRNYGRIGNADCNRDMVGIF